MTSPFSLDGGIHEVPAPTGRMWLCGKHVAAPDPDALLARLPATTMVCLVEDHEVGSRWPDYLPWLARHDGERALRHPIGDFGAPALDDFLPFLHVIVERMRSGAGVVIHCAGGIGRSGTTAAAVLMLLGMPAADALDHVRAHRPMAGPEVGAQRALIADLTTLLERL